MAGSARSMTRLDSTRFTRRVGSQRSSPRAAASQSERRHRVRARMERCLSIDSTVPFMPTREVAAPVPWRFACSYSSIDRFTSSIASDLIRSGPSSSSSSSSHHKHALSSHLGFSLHHLPSAVSHLHPLRVPINPLHTSSFRWECYPRRPFHSCICESA